MSAFCPVAPHFPGQFEYTAPVNQVTFLESRPAIPRAVQNQSPTFPINCSSPLPGPSSYNPQKSRRHQDHIPRPDNCFFLFKREFNAVAKMGTSQNNLNKEAGRVWKDVLSENERQRYKYRAQLATLEHRRMFPDYKYTPTKGNKEKASKSTGQRKRTSGKKSKIPVEDDSSHPSSNIPSSFTTLAPLHPPLVSLHPPAPSSFVQLTFDDQYQGPGALSLLPYPYYVPNAEIPGTSFSPIVTPKEPFVSDEHKPTSPSYDLEIMTEQEAFDRFIDSDMVIDTPLPYSDYSEFSSFFE